MTNKSKQAFDKAHRGEANRDDMKIISDTFIDNMVSALKRQGVGEHECHLSSFRYPLGDIIDPPISAIAFHGLQVVGLLTEQSTGWVVRYWTADDDGRPMLSLLGKWPTSEEAMKGLSDAFHDGMPCDPTRIIR
jgi:hypothetical protein